jgi:phage terminase small subunit
MREMMSKLTPKQKRFVEEYLVDLNAAAAARRAGYSEKTADKMGAKLVVKSSIQEAIQLLQNNRSQRTEITADNVLRELAALGFSDLRHYVIDDNGHVSLAAGAPDIAMRAVSSIKRKVRSVPGREGVEDIETEIKLWPKNSALELIAKHLGMLIEKREHSGKVEVQTTPRYDMSSLTVEELLALKALTEKVEKVPCCESPQPA